MPSLHPACFRSRPLQYLTKRVDALEQGPAAQGTRPALEAMRAQVDQLGGQLQELQGQQRALEAGAATVSQLAAVQGQLEEASATGPRVRARESFTRKDR